MRGVVAIFLGVGLLAAQVAHGGALIPFLAAPAMICVLIAGAAAVVASFWERPSVPNILMISGALLLGYGVWRCASSPDLEVARIDSGQVLLYGVAWLAAAFVASSSRFRWWIFGVVGLSCLAGAAVAVWQLAVKGDSPLPVWWSEELRLMYLGRFSNRVRGFFLNPNQFAWLMNAGVLLFLAAGLWGRVSVLMRIVLLYFAGVFTVAMALTASRGGIVALMVGLAVFGIASLCATVTIGRRGRVFAVSMALVATAFVALAGWWTVSHSWVVQGRVDSVFTADVREAFLRHGFRQFQTEPLLGSGAGQFLYAARSYRGPGEHRDAFFAHSDWLQLLAEYGFVGFVLMALFLALILLNGFAVFWRSVRAAHDDGGGLLTTRGALALGATSTLAAYGVHSLVDFNMHIPANGIMAAVLAGIASVPAVIVTGRLTFNRIGTVLLGMALVVGLGLWIWRYVPADYFAFHAKNAVQSGSPDEALVMVQKGLASRPDHPMLHEVAGDVNFGYESFLQFSTLSDGDESEVDVDYDESDSPVLSDADRRSRYEAAVAAYGKAATLQPQERRHFVDLSEALFEVKRYDESLRAARRAIAIDPFHSYTWVNYGDILVELGRLDEALRAFEVGSKMSGYRVAVAAAEDLRYEIEISREEDAE